MNKKRVWEVLVQPNSDVGYVANWQLCQICRANKDSYCTDCEADKINYGTWCRDVWMILMCGRNRRDTCLARLNVHSLTLIYAYSIAQNSFRSSCPLTVLPCGTSYHEHCFSKWAAKKGPRCPNCSRVAIAPLVTQPRDVQLCATLLVYDTSDAKRGRHCDPPHLEAALVRTLKHRDPREGGLSAEQLRGALTWSVEPTVVLFALKSLVGREYLVYDERTEIYQYNP